MIRQPKTRSRLAAIALVISSILLTTLSCDLGDIVGDDDLSLEDQAATVQAMIEEQLGTLQAPSATPEPSATTQMLDCSAATFNLDPSVAASVTFETVPQAVGDPTIPFSINPDTAKYSFQGYVVAGHYHDAVIRIYPVDDYAALDPTIGNSAANLATMLQNQPNDPTVGIPALPRWNAAQLLRAKISYIDFQNGSGVRFLTQYGQAYWMVNNQDMIYFFQGLTNDGACWISAIFPASNPALPNVGAVPPGGEPEMIDYYVDIVPQINAMGDTSFLPDLNTLDALIASLLVQ